MNTARTFALITGIFLIFGLLAPGNTFPREARQALRNATQATLYSLEPWEHSLPAGHALPELEGFSILEQTELNRKQTDTAATAIRDAVKGWHDRAACFDPRHALRVSFGNHTFDFLLCYACHQLAIYRDGEHLTTLSAGGPSTVLDNLLTAADVPLSRTGRPQSSTLHR